MKAKERRKAGGAEPGTASRSSSISDPGAKTFCETLQASAKKEKRSKKERKLRKGKPVETAAAVEIDKGGLRQLLLDDFHRFLKKSTHKTLRLFHSCPQARQSSTSFIYFSEAAIHLKHAVSWS
jgi:hypothetical protein